MGVVQRALSTSRLLSDPDRTFSLTPTLRYRVKTPTGRLGILPSSLQERSRDSANPPTGRLGIFHDCLSRLGPFMAVWGVFPRLGWNEIPNLPVGGLRGAGTSFSVGWNEKSPTCRLGDYAEQAPHFP